MHDPALPILAILLLITIATPLCARQKIDGRIFAIQITGKASGSQTTTRLVFRNGKLITDVYKTNGVPPAPYTVTGNRFRANFPCVNGGRAAWRGEVNGSRVTGTIRHTKPGSGTFDFEFTGEPEASLYVRIGGEKAVVAVVDKFIDRFLADKSFASNRVVDQARRKVDPDRFKYGVVNFVGQAIGGPQKYEGRTMKVLHAEMAITADEFNRVAQHLVAVLQELKVPQTLQNELMAIVGSTKGDIVTRR